MSQRASRLEARESTAIGMSFLRLVVHSLADKSGYTSLFWLLDCTCFAELLCGERKATKQLVKNDLAGRKRQGGRTLSDLEGYWVLRQRLDPLSDRDIRF